MTFEHPVFFFLIWWIEIKELDLYSKKALSEKSH